MKAPEDEDRVFARVGRAIAILAAAGAAVAFVAAVVIAITDESASPPPLPPSCTASACPAPDPTVSGVGGRRG